MSDIREKIQKIITTEYSLEENWRTKTDEEVANEILSIVREAVMECKPNIQEIMKTSIGETETSEKYQNLVVEGYKLGVSDFDQAITEVLS